MSGGNCYRKGYERGPWFEIKSMADIIKTKETNGHDATYERSLLKSWADYEGYEKSKEALSALA